MKSQLLLLSLCCIGGMLGASEASRTQAIADNLREYGTLCVRGDHCGTAIQQVAAGSGGGRRGETIYQTFCIACHAAGISGAPLFGSAAAWRPLRARGLDALVNQSITGIGAMPPKGLCMDCSKGEMRATIQYMLDQAK